MPTEADARIVVDRLLREADWDIENKSVVSTEEATADGRADYLLKNSRTRPLCIVETKRFSIDSYSAKKQTKEYAVSLGAPFIILSNGREHYFWDYETGDARPIIGFPTQADLENRADLRQHRQGDLATSIRAVPIPVRFRFKGEDVDARPYQLQCLKAADDALITGRRRMLFEMATGTGKTLTIAMLMKRWFQSAAISRVLFLADRIELAKQAKETFDDYLRDYPAMILFGGKKSLEGQIVVGTLDTIAGQLGPGGFGHAYFDLVITDECHRSIYNTHRATLAHFDAAHIGLTATPNPGELHWVSEHERQLIRSTYMFFDCWDSAAQEGRPTFAYTIREGIKEKFLADYKIYSAESVLTFEGTDWDDEEISFSDWGRNAESEDRLKLIIDEYFRVDEERPQPHPRKTIVFAVGNRQADILVRLFNQLLPAAACLRIAQQTNRSPAEVRSDFAQKITCYSNNGNPKPIIDRFKFDPLPIIAVSVDMLDTGYDHKEIENLVMLRPTSSAIKYAQMRGRGSRLCPRIGKTSFLIYDFVGNHTRFNDPGTEYHRPRQVGKRPISGEPEPEPGPEPTPPPPPGPPQPPREFTLIPMGVKEDSIHQPEINKQLPLFIKTCRNLQEIWSFIKPKFDHYHERREFIREEFDPLLAMLEAVARSPGDDSVTATVTRISSSYVKETWQKAVERRATDPEGAITAARTLLESVCKHILDGAGATYDDNTDLPKLYGLTSRHLNLSPSQHTEQLFKQILGGCQTVVEGLGALRNRHSDAHGKGSAVARPAPRHAELAVNLAGTMATFLLQTWEARNHS